MRQAEVGAGISAVQAPSHLGRQVSLLLGLQTDQTNLSLTLYHQVMNTLNKYKKGRERKKKKKEEKQTAFMKEDTNITDTFTFYIM